MVTVAGTKGVGRGKEEGTGLGGLVNHWRGARVTDREEGMRPKSMCSRIFGVWTCTSAEGEAGEEVWVMGLAVESG